LFPRFVVTISRGFISTFYILFFLFDRFYILHCSTSGDAFCGKECWKKAWWSFELVKIWYFHVAAEEWLVVDEGDEARNGMDGYG
jgi:hypothetical protein